MIAFDESTPITTVRGLVFNPAIFIRCKHVQHSASEHESVFVNKCATVWHIWQKNKHGNGIKHKSAKRFTKFHNQSTAYTETVNNSDALTNVTIYHHCTNSALQLLLQGVSALLHITRFHRFLSRTNSSVVAETYDRSFMFDSVFAFFKSWQLWIVLRSINSDFQKKDDLFFKKFK